MAMLQLAALDYSYQRLPSALEKYGALANLFGDLGDKAMVSLCLCGAGDVHLRAGQHSRARVRYLQGVELAASVQARPVLLNCLTGLAQTTYAMRRFDESEVAWDGAARVAGSMGNPYAVADAVEQMGVCRAAQNRLTEAFVVWERGLEHLVQYPYGHREVSILQRMVELAREQGWAEHERVYRARLAAAKMTEARQGGPA
jgi:tetratricopeptide (TPR) repeat protein